MSTLRLGPVLAGLLFIFNVLNFGVRGQSAARTKDTTGGNHQRPPLGLDESLFVTDDQGAIIELVAGKYPGETSPEGETYRTAWSAASRKTLRQDAEGTGQTVEIKPCQRTTDYSFAYGK